MCGRTRCALAPDDILEAANVSKDRWKAKDAYNPRHNCAPGSGNPVILCDSDNKRMLETMRWGLIPSFNKPQAKPDFFRAFNARSETCHVKPTFRRLVDNRRCVAIIEGFYEWKVDRTGLKQPYYVYSTQGVIFLAALWDSWTDDNGDTLHTYACMTTDACERLQWLHHRMPVILSESEARTWLDPTVRMQAILADPSSRHMLESKDHPALRWHPVSKKMSKLSEQGEWCSAPIDLEKERAKKFGVPLTSFFKATGPSHSDGGNGSGATVSAGGVKSEADSDGSIKEEAESAGYIKREADSDGAIKEEAGSDSPASAVASETAAQAAPSTTDLLQGRTDISEEDRAAILAAMGPDAPVEPHHALHPAAVDLVSDDDSEAAAMVIAGDITMGGATKRTGGTQKRKRTTATPPRKTQAAAKAGAGGSPQKQMKLSAFFSSPKPK